MNRTAGATAAQSTERPDRLEDIESEMLRPIDHIGVAASIADVYAERMRAFQRAGNEASERDQFRAALAREFGYHPTDNGRT